jgi:predicted transcriptional regulator
MPRHDLQQFASKGGVHRTTEHHGRPAANETPEPIPEAPPSTRKGGRPKAFEEETVKVALFLPPDLAGTLKALAARHRLTPSLVVAEWIQKAEVREAIARGRQAFKKGDVVSHEEALQRLSKW